MVKIQFTTEMREAGQQLLALLDQAKFPIRACFWFYFSDAEMWRFVVASSVVRLRGALVAYGKIRQVSDKVPNATEMFGPGDITALQDDDPLVKALRRSLGRGRRASGRRITRTVIDRIYVDDAYVYRVT